MSKAEAARKKTTRPDEEGESPFKDGMTVLIHCRLKLNYADEH